MPRISKIELSPDNGCVIDMKWSLGPLSYRASALGKVDLEPTKEITRLPELVLYDHIGFKGSYARTNLSFHYVGDYWNDRMSCVIVVSGVWRFFATIITKARTGTSAPDITKASSPRKVPTTSSAPSSASR